MMRFAECLFKTQCRLSGILWSDVGKTQKKALSAVPLDPPVRKWRRSKSVSSGSFSPVDIVLAVLETRQKMHSAGLQLKIDLLPEGIHECHCNGCAAVVVKLPHPLNVTGEVAFPHEVGNDGLIECRQVAIQRDANPSQSFDLRLRDHEVSKPQAREQDLTETPDVEDPIGSIETFQSGERTTGIAELGVIVILDDPGTGACRPREERGTSRRTQRNTKRRLVRRSHISDAGPRRSRDPRVDVEPFGVNR